jgi:hypothetical protein
LKKGLKWLKKLKKWLKKLAEKMAGKWLKKWFVVRSNISGHTYFLSIICSHHFAIHKSIENVSQPQDHKQSSFSLSGLCFTIMCM